MENNHKGSKKEKKKETYKKKILTERKNRGIYERNQELNWRSLLLPNSLTIQFQHQTIRGGKIFTFGDSDNRP